MTDRLGLLCAVAAICSSLACNDRVDLGKNGGAPDGGATNDGGGVGADGAATPDGVSTPDSISVPGNACTPGADQTCNDDATVSTLWGVCEANGTCTCNSGFVVNPTTGRCRPDCQSEADLLAQEMYTPAGRSCTAVVRLKHDSLSIIGYQLLCGKYAAVDETKARATAQADTGYGDKPDEMLNAAKPDLYVFYKSPGDFGGVGVVSALTGLSVFGGSVVYLGAGDISYPKSWRTLGLGGHCPPQSGTSQPKLEGYDLAKETALDQARADAAWKVVEQTAIPAAIWKGGYLFDVTVLLYPRSVGEFNPATAEWVVLVTGGWLE